MDFLFKNASFTLGDISSFDSSVFSNTSASPIPVATVYETKMEVLDTINDTPSALIIGYDLTTDEAKGFDLLSTNRIFVGTRGNEAVLRICHVAGFPVDSGRGCGLYHRRRALQLPQGEIYTLGLPSFCYARYGLSYDRRVEDYRNDVSLPRENLKFEPVLPVARKNQNFTSTVIATIYNCLFHRKRVISHCKTFA